MTQSELLIQRRRNIVPNGIGFFNTATAASAKGALVIDADGKELIDFAGGIGVLNAGHCPELVTQAIADQAAKLMHICFNVATYEPYLNLAEKLATLFPHGPKTKVMITNTGAESVENAIKIARQFTKKSGVICFSESFHGRSMMAMTLTSKTAYKKNCGPFAPEVYRMPFPNYYTRGKGLTFDEFVDREILQLENNFNSYADANQIAAIIIEPVQGEGGFHVVPPRYFKALRRVCDLHNIVLIVDEVQSGFGRTGKWGAYQHFDIEPDLSTWAKSMGSGMPIGCVIGKAHIMDAAEPGTIGGTYLGNPVCCAASLATINYMEAIDINRLGQEVGDRIKNTFERFKDSYACIGSVRGLGAMLAFDLVKDNDPNKPDAEACKKVIQICAEKGLILLSAGIHNNVIRVLSPLTIEKEVLQKGLDIIDSALHQVSESNN